MAGTGQPRLTWTGKSAADIPAASMVAVHPQFLRGRGFGWSSRRPGRASPPRSSRDRSVRSSPGFADRREAGGAAGGPFTETGEAVRRVGTVPFRDISDLAARCVADRAFAAALAITNPPRSRIRHGRGRARSSTRPVRDRAARGRSRHLSPVARCGSRFRPSRPPTPDDPPWRTVSAPGDHGPPEQVGDGSGLGCRAPSAAPGGRSGAPHSLALAWGEC